MTQKLRRFFITINNYTPKDIKSWEKECKESTIYSILGKEVGKKSGIAHIHILLHYENARTWESIKKKFPRGDIEAAIGNDEQCRTYISKEGNFIEHGKPSIQGERTDIKKTTDEIMEGKVSVDEIAVSNPQLYHQYGRTLQKVEDIALRKKFRTWMTTCDWYVGPTSTGKSHKAFENFNPETHYVWKYDNGWQDGYTGQEIVIINEFRGQIKFSELLELIDKWPKEISRRGRAPVPFLAHKIIITSSLLPHEIYHGMTSHSRDSIEQLLDRIRIIKMTQKYSRGNINNS